jgi:hypothetical protein
MANEADIAKAISDLDSMEKPNFFAVAKKYNVNRTTLTRRYKGQTVSNREATSVFKQLLTDAQEDVLLEHISKLTARGLPPTPQMLRNIVIKAVGHDIGECWVRRFCHRHEDRIKSLYLRGIDQTRKVADNSEHFEHFYHTV